MATNVSMEQSAQWSSATCSACHRQSPSDGMARLRFSKTTLLISYFTLIERSCQFKHLIDASRDGVLEFSDLDERADGPLYHWLLHGEFGPDNYNTMVEDDWFRWLKQLVKYSAWCDRYGISELNNILVDRVYSLCSNEYQNINLPSIALLAQFLRKGSKMYDLLVAILAFLPDVKHRDYLELNGLCSEFTKDVSLKFAGRVFLNNWNSFDPESAMKIDLLDYYEEPHCDVVLPIEPGSWLSGREGVCGHLCSTLPPHHTLPMLPEERRTMSRIPPRCMIFSAEQTQGDATSQSQDAPTAESSSEAASSEFTIHPTGSSETAEEPPPSPELSEPPSPPLLERDSFLDIPSLLLPSTALGQHFEGPELLSIDYEISSPYERWNPSLILPDIDCNGKPIPTKPATDLQIIEFDEHNISDQGRPITPDDNIPEESLLSPISWPCAQERVWIPRPEGCPSPQDSAISVQDGPGLRPSSTRSPSPRPSSILLRYPLGQGVTPVKANEPPSYLLDPESYLRPEVSVAPAPKKIQKKGIVEHLGAMSIKHVIREKISGARNIKPLSRLCRNSYMSPPSTRLWRSESVN